MPTYESTTAAPTDAEQVVPYIQSLWPDTEILITTESKQSGTKVTYLEMPTLTEEQFTTLLTDIKTRFPGAF
jgi:hypothetical protein